MDIFFGTDGWRGILCEQINEDSVATVAQALADYLKMNSLGSAAVGYDGRKKSDSFAEIFAEVLSGNGIDIILSDRVIPTPVLSFTVKKRNLSCGVMITASHNPAEYNGIKFKDHYGGPFFTEKTLLIENRLYKAEIKKNRDKISIENLVNSYFEELDIILDKSLIAIGTQKIVVDSMHGAGGTVIEGYLARFERKNITTIASEILNDFGGRNAEPIEKNLTPLIYFLKEHEEFGIGLATDGDADRLGVVSSGGEWLSAQETILLLADYVKNVKKIGGDLIKTSSVTGKFDKVFSGIKVHEVQVGFKYICEKMIETKAAFGAEESGGFGYGFFMPERDGILSALLFVEMLEYYNVQSLKQLLQLKREEFGEIFYDRIDHPYHKSDRTELLPKLYESSPDELAGFKVKSISGFLSSRGIINGIKFHFEEDDRWLLIRASETEPLIRIYAEGKTMAEVKNLLETGKKLFS
ncbi:MAG: phosphoesterase [Melioribacteraceae bacterium]|nr:MAG: phosphoesterase [Melioribacteraceae bacterium]